MGFSVRYTSEPVWFWVGTMTGTDPIRDSVPVFVAMLSERGACGCGPSVLFVDKLLGLRPVEL